MNPENFTSKSKEVLLVAGRLADEQNHGAILPAHLALALLGQTEGIVYPLLDRIGVDPVALRRSLDEALESRP